MQDADRNADTDGSVTGYDPAHEGTESHFSAVLVMRASILTVIRKTPETPRLSLERKKRTCRARIVAHAQRYETKGRAAKVY